MIRFYLDHLHVPYQRLQQSPGQDKGARTGQRPAPDAVTLWLVDVT